MREVIRHKDDKTTVKISSPWLSPEEAVLYLGISHTKFYDIADRIPCRRIGSRRLYHTDDLDAFDKNNKDGSDGKAS